MSFLGDCPTRPGSCTADESTQVGKQSLGGERWPRCWPPAVLSFRVKDRSCLQLQEHPLDQWPGLDSAQGQVSTLCRGTGSEPPRFQGPVTRAETPQPCARAQAAAPLPQDGRATRKSASM